jgi:hypothetical protein
MRSETLINRPFFRFLSPLLVGIVAYFLILLGFDSISRLRDNILSIEIMLCIAVSFGVLESLRFAIRLFYSRLSKLLPSAKWEIPLQIALSIIITFVFVSAIISLYYRYLIGFSSFTTELLVFNSIFLFVAITYNMLYISLVYLGKTNRVAIDREIEQKENVETELKEYISKINPSFLFFNLERILVDLRINPGKASEQIQMLSQVYRHILLSKGNSLVALTNEIEHLKVLVSLYNEPSNEGIKLEIGNVESSRHIVSGTIHVLVMFLTSRFIVQHSQPLAIRCNIINDRLQLVAVGLQRLIPLDFSSTELNVLNRAYKYYLGEEIVFNNTDLQTEISVGLITVEEQNANISE